MGKRRAEGRPYRAAGMESDASARLKRLTRAELIKLVTKLETPAAIVEREPGGEEKPLAPHKPTMLVNGSIRSGSMRRNQWIMLKDLQVFEKVADGWLDEDVGVAAPLEAPP